MHLIVQRSKGFGDVIAATATVEHLAKAGHTITFQTESLCRQVVEGNRFILNIEKSYEKTPDINLDVPEICQRQKDLHLQEAFALVAKRMIPMAYPVIRPNINISEEEKAWVVPHLSRFPRPWIFVCPGSWQATARTVADSTWSELVPMLSGTLFNPTNSTMNWVNYIGNGTFRGLMAAMTSADLLITVDSGPMHVAASLGVPIVAIEQAWPIYLRIPTGSPCETVSCGQMCSPCRDHICQRQGTSKISPPCQMVSAKAIADAAHRMLALNRF